MAIVKPFAALRPHPAYAAQLASRPYDVLSSEEARAEVAGNPLSFLHVTKAEIDLPADVAIHSEAVYRKAAENLQALIKKKVLFAEGKPCFYIYQLTWKGRSQTGLVCTSSVDDYNKGIIKKHEFTRPEKEKDRIDHMRTIKAQTGNVFLACKASTALSSVMDQWKDQNVAVYNFAATDGVQHTVWVVDAPATIAILEEIFETELTHTYIADGHHRAASAAKVQSYFPESASANYFLTTIFPANELAILDYNRIAKDLNRHTPESFLQALQQDFDITPQEGAFRPQALHQFGMYLQGKWYKLVAKEGVYTTDPIGVLDVSILQARVLDALLDIKDPRTDNRVDFVGGIRGLEELQKRVDSGTAAVAFSLYPVSIQQLFDIADSGEVMPPKSTWFEPKLRDGLFTHLIG